LVIPVGHRRLNRIGTLGGVSVVTAGSTDRKVDGVGAGTAGPTDRMIGDAGGAVPTVHRDGRGFRLAVGKSLLSDSRAAVLT
jgi:hypothetical protein